jgi:hypothetical protein
LQKKKQDRKRTNRNVIKKIDTRSAALILIEIAYSEGKINERTYANIQRKYA